MIHDTILAKLRSELQDRLEKGFEDTQEALQAANLCQLVINLIDEIMANRSRIKDLEERLPQ